MTIVISASSPSSYFSRNARRSAAVYGLAIGSLLFSSLASAFGIGTISPTGLPGNETSVTVTNGGVIDLNPGRNVVTNPVSGEQTVSSVNVDTTNGVIRGYSSYSLSNPYSHASITDATGAATSGFVGLNDTYVVGPSNNPNFQNAVDVTVEMDIHGVFDVTQGSPTLLLTGDLTATKFDQGNPFDATLYQSLLLFTTSALQSPVDPVDTQFTGVASHLFTGISGNYAGATATVHSETLANLDATISLTFPVLAGDVFSIMGVAVGIASGEPDPNNDSDLDNGYDLLASAGAVDFSSTANIRILLPEGYSLGGSDPLIGGIVQTSPVPVPAAAWLFGSALLTLVHFRRRV